MPVPMDRTATVRPDDSSSRERRFSPRRHPRSAPSLRRVRSRGRRPGSRRLTLAAPDTPVKWDIADDNKPIADGLAPEKGATLKIYNYADYLSPEAVKGFEDQVRRARSRSRPSTTPTRRSPRCAAAVNYDIYYPNYDRDQPAGEWATWSDR